MTDPIFIDEIVVKIIVRNFDVIESRVCVNDDEIAFDNYFIYMQWSAFWQEWSDQFSLISLAIL